ncbi:hypothetical protein OIU77_024161 [Salix suchowensis]|uniref:Uncharacterized protein n=1 Tax=Salix suchowensis TaxID=1278906 RepID=A0ABQ9BTE5_9ROSI|nr:hypothetical protein OIU77_024161 [Salix suchowensis]
MTISLLIVAVSFFVKGFASDDSSLYTISGILSVVGVVAMVITFSLGMGPILNADSSGQHQEPCWKCSNTSQLDGLLFDHDDCKLALGLEYHMVVSAFALVFVSLWVPETKGRTLEEIQSSFR